MLLALFGATAGQGVVWYTGQFYALFFLQNTLKVDFGLSYVLVAVALLIGTPFFVVFGRLSDRIGRKRIMVAGCLLRGADVIPDLSSGLTHYANPALGGLRASRRHHGGRARLSLQHLRQAIDAVRSRARLPDQGGPELRVGRRSTVTTDVVTTIAGVRSSASTKPRIEQALDGSGYPAKQQIPRASTFR